MMTGVLFSKTKGYKDIQFKTSTNLFKLILCCKKRLCKRYQNMLDILRKKTKGNMLCLSKCFTIS